jgi:hypothetical protein
MDKDLYREDPRDYALGLVEDGVTTAEHLNLVLIKFMSHDDVREALRINDLAPEDLGAGEEE